MSLGYTIRPIAHIHTDFPEKFGIPRQSGLVPALRGHIQFEEEFRNPEALRGLDEYSHLWLIWGFSGSIRENWSPTVRPPRLGGNQRMGVFATRSPFRPNGLGLSCVHLDRIDLDHKQGPVLYVSGVDMMDGTPIFDMKPYLPYADCYPDAKEGFAGEKKDYALQVLFPEELSSAIPLEIYESLTAVLAQDPRPSYQNNPERVYGMQFAGYEVKFRADEKNIYVLEIFSPYHEEGL